MDLDRPRTGAGTGAPLTGGAKPGPNPSVSDGSAAAKPDPSEPSPSAPKLTRRDSDDVSQDDRDVGWGETRPDSRDDDWYRRERPPHHD